MIRLSLKISDLDKEMVELIGGTYDGKPILWTVCHKDFVYEDRDLQEALESGEEIPMKLMKG